MVRPRTIDREAVLDAAEAIVVQRGARELSFDAVATAAGITKGGVQSCFGTKENLISAMLQRWGDAYEQAKRELLAAPGGEGLGPVQLHVQVTAQADSLNRRAASLMAALLQSREQLGWLQAWYGRQLGGLDVSTDDGRRKRLAFLATEGAFMLHYLGLAPFDDAQWAGIFRDIGRCAGNGPEAAGSCGTVGDDRSGR